MKQFYQYCNFVKSFFLETHQFFFSRFMWLKINYAWGKSWFNMLITAVFYITIFPHDVIIILWLIIINEWCEYRDICITHLWLSLGTFHESFYFFLTFNVFPTYCRFESQKLIITDKHVHIFQGFAKITCSAGGRQLPGGEGAGKAFL